MLRDPEDPTSEETPDERRALQEALDKVPRHDTLKLDRTLKQLEEERLNRQPQGGYIPRCRCHIRYRD